MWNFSFENNKTECGWLITHSWCCFNLSALVLSCHYLITDASWTQHWTVGFSFKKTTIKQQLQVLSKGNNWWNFQLTFPMKLWNFCPSYCRSGCVCGQMWRTHCCCYCPDRAMKRGIRWYNYTIWGYKKTSLGPRDRGLQLRWWQSGEWLSSCLEWEKRLRAD